MDTLAAIQAAATSATNSLAAGWIEPEEARMIASVACELAETMEAAAENETLPHPSQ